MMTNISDAMNHYNQEFDRIKQQLIGYDITWLTELRERALGRFNELGFPTSRDEEWKYTRVTPVTNKLFTSNETQSDTLNLETIRPYLIKDQDCFRLVFVDGFFTRYLSDVTDLPEGMMLINTAEQLKRDPENLSHYLQKRSDASSSLPHAFSALNTALMSDAAYIYIPEGVTVKKPIHILFINTNNLANKAIYPYNIINVQENGHVQIIEDYIGLNSETTYFTNSYTHIHVLKNASIHHYKLQQESNHAYHIATVGADISRDSKLSSYVFSFGGKLVRSDTHIGLNEQGANCNLNGFYMTQQRQHMDFHTRIDHKKTHGTSREFYKGILMDRSRAVFNGKVIVHPNAQKTDASQSNKNLLLSKHAEIDTKPELEIYNDDVKCTHGATVGELNQDALFYLRSRGIDYDTAKNMLIYAFASEIVDAVQQQALRHHLYSLMNQQITTDKTVRELLWTQ